MRDLGQQRTDHNDEVEDVPRLAQVGTRVHAEAHTHDLKDTLCGESTDKVCLGTLDELVQTRQVLGIIIVVDTQEQRVEDDEKQDYVLEMSMSNDG